MAAHSYYPPVNQPFYPPTAPPPPPPQPFYSSAAQPYYSTTQYSYSNYPYPSSTQQPTCYYPPVYTVPLPPVVPAERPVEAVITNPITIVGPQYCLPRPVDLMVIRKLMTLTNDFTVKDVAKNTMFKVKGKLLSVHDKRVLLDASGTPTLTLTNKIMSAHSRWKVYRGASTRSADLIFSAKTSSIIQLKTRLNVYLANRKSEDFCDFRVEGSWSEDSSVVYVGETSTIAAQMNKKDSAASFFLGKDTFMVTVNPNVDYAFVVSLILILDAINDSSLTSNITTVANLVAR
ncbi:OLC1v1025149C1 [Oldenlandia corymbosa var. corymbosa]|uniref:OLC1v1025149C1 n=1 Tax=Oldenlandia corymbosa var. corymbosa TaxID=529605 RepID=A0AAV1C426_OLDCO|nr:OLC1v1025149C1 [Oldenlandia corymbosa var. corymbosa]